jgi:isopentenyl diphosphate isomerase/L-lactate dehydrogenase-like FMN-dependent dehydrogenase
MPILVAPVAFQRLAHPGGEPAMACAARAAGTIMCVSTLATAAPAECADAAGEGRRWLQLYVFRDRGISQALIDEATEAGYEAIVLTVDAPYGGRRERDLRTGFTLPADVRTPAIDAAASRRDLTIAEVFGLVDPSLTWSDVESLISDTELPVLIKGVLTAEDAELAVEHGAAGIVVSNHGARQIDAVPAPIDVLGEVVDAVGGRIEVLMDGGVRRGTDVAVALALGAKAVLVGRPAVWGLAVDGQAGAELALGILQRELQLTLALLGAPSPAELGPAHARRRRAL